MSIPKNNRGRSLGTRKAIARVNLERKIDRLRGELAGIAKGESDRLFAESPTLLKVILMLKQIVDLNIEISEDCQLLAEECESLLVESHLAFCDKRD